MNSNAMNTTAGQYGYDNRHIRRGSPLPSLGGMDLNTPRGQHDVVSPSSSASGLQSGGSHSMSSGTPYSQNSWNTGSGSNAFGFPSHSNSVGSVSDSHHYDSKPASFDSASSGLYTVSRPSPGSGPHLSYGQHSANQQPGYPSIYNHNHNHGHNHGHGHGHGHGNTTPGASSSHPSHGSISATSPGGIMGHSNAANSQPPTPSSAGPHDAYSRPTSYFPASNTPHQSSFPPVTTPHQSSFPACTTPHQSSYPAYAPNQQPSPPGLSLGASRSLHPSIGMAPPQGFKPFSGFGLSMPPNPIMSNLANPGGPMAVMPGIPYGHHQMSPGIYGHAVAQPERPYKCLQCPQSFNRNHDLKRHTRIHLSVKPFPCGSCDKAFSRKDALKRHRLVKGCGDPATNAETNSNPDGSGQSDASASQSPTNTRQE